eukprot:TRINITY_DN7400_c0_g1_i1.p1 TRINITY_DN7400_c0_g1~~TRINITY_DN7400_c0_g1_i1.p1  ORF type:complete len:365 (-),score=81.58 TRINITY_DN7400_c0_g1_i1:181-1155(-)
MSGVSFRYYDLLECDKHASVEDIKRNYKKLALKWHPDKNKSPGAAEKFREITEAYHVLSDDAKRMWYDSYGDNIAQSNTSPTDFVVSEVALGFITVLLLSPFDAIAKRARVVQSPFRPRKFPRLATSSFLGLGTSFLSSFVYSRVRETMYDASEPLSFWPAAMVAQFFSYPLEMLDTCVKTKNISAFGRLVRHGGLSGLFRGFSTFLLHNIASFGAGFLVDQAPINAVVEEKMKQRIEKNELGKAFLTKFGFILAKLTAVSLVTCPIKTVTLRLQLNSLNHTSESIPSIIREGGIKGLYAGFFADVLYSFVSVIVTNIAARLLI